MSFTLAFGTTTKPRNSTKIPSMSGSCQVLLKDDTSIVRPTWRVHLGHGGAPANLAELSKMNCCYCAEFDRYYFITNIISETAVIALVVCEVDVLATYRTEIFGTDAFIMYAESQFNAMIPDGRLPLYGASEATFSSLALSHMDNEGSFVVTAATPNTDGRTGPSASVVMSQGQLMTMANTLYGQDFWDSIKNEFYHPEEAIIGCKWTPISVGSASGGGSSNIQVGKYNLGSGPNAKRLVSEQMLTSIYIPHADDDPTIISGWDYRNLEPYTQYYLWLPGAGMVQLPMKLFIGGAKAVGAQLPLRIDYAASPITGDVTYLIQRQVDSSGAMDVVGTTLLTVKGNFGVDIPIGAVKGSYGSVLQSVAGAIGSGVIAVAGAVTGNPAALIGGTVGALGSSFKAGLDSNETYTTVSGGLSGWSIGEAANTKIGMATVAYKISDEPMNITKTIGRPLFMKKTIGSMSGLIKCTGAFVQCNATEEEHQMLAQYVNSSTNFIYGGVIIE